MISRSLIAVALGALLLGAAPTFSAPAGNRPAGTPHALRPFDAILPDGRTVAPVGASIAVGTGALGLALSADGRYAVVVNGNRAYAGVTTSQGGLVGGSSLAVVDTASMRVVAVVAAAHAGFTGAIAMFRDPANPSGQLVAVGDARLHMLRLYALANDGQLVAQAPVALPASAHARYPAAGGALPEGIAASPDGSTLYVTDRNASRLDVVNVASRHVSARVRVGDDPAGIALAGTRVLVAERGLMAYANLSAPVTWPTFTAPAFTLGRDSGLNLLLRGDTGAGMGAYDVAMDPAPNGTDIIGGAQPTAVALSKSGKFAYVALTNDDRVAIVALGPTPHVVRGLDLRFYPGAPYGTQPVALATSRDGKRLFVALSGFNAVAVLDASKPGILHRLGLIPTGARPQALAVARNGRFLYVANAGGYSMGWSTLQRIDLHKLTARPSTLLRVTYSALRYARVEEHGKRDAVLPALGSKVRSAAISHVITLVVGASTYDAIFGNAQQAAFPGTATAHLRALAAKYALAGNFYEESATASIDRAVLLGGIATNYRYEDAYARAPGEPSIFGADDPENYPRAGYLFNALARAGLSYRDYGGLLNLSGRNARGQYTRTVPGLAALQGHIARSYHIGAHVNDTALAQAFLTDYGHLVRSGQAPDFAYVRLPSESANATDADAMRRLDTALGRIVSGLKREATWGSTAVFIVPGGTARMRDSVHPQHAYAILVSPFAKRAYLSPRHLSLASIVKSEEELLGLPALSLGDLLASDFSDSFAALQAASPAGRTKERQ